MGKVESMLRSIPSDRAEIEHVRKTILTFTISVLPLEVSVLFTSMDALSRLNEANGEVNLFSGFVKIGGMEGLQYEYFKSIPSVRDENSTCGFPRADAFHVFRDPTDSDNPWPGLVLQASLGCLWYWCCDQVSL